MHLNKKNLLKIEQRVNTYDDKNSYTGLKWKYTKDYFIRETFPFNMTFSPCKHSPSK